MHLWDWSEIENKGARFENLVASHLLKYCDFLTDTGIGNFELRYIKNKEKFEIDFLILRNKKAFLAIEAKLSDSHPSPSWNKFLSHLNCPFGIQLVKKPQIHKVHEYPDHKILVMSAADFLQNLV